MPAIAKTPKPFRHREAVASALSTAKVDEAKGTIEGIVLLGPNSKNVGKGGKPRRYSEAAMKDAVSRYEGRPLFKDHDVESTTGVRSVDSQLGVIKNARFEDGKIKGDAVISAKESWFLKDAASPELSKSMGFSHDAMIDTREGSDFEEVVAIGEVFSVDLVTRPATTKGVFESVATAADRAAEQAGAKVVVKDWNGSEVIGTVVEEGPAYKVLVGDYARLVFVKDTEPMSDAGAETESKIMADTTKDKPTTTEAETKLAKENTALRVKLAGVGLPAKASEALTRRFADKIATDAEITEAVTEIKAIVEEASAGKPATNTEAAKPAGTAADPALESGAARKHGDSGEPQSSDKNSGDLALDVVESLSGHRGYAERRRAEFAKK